MHHLFPQRWEEYWAKHERSILVPLCRDCHDNIEQLLLLVEFDPATRLLYRLPRWCYWAVVEFFMRDDVDESIIKALYVARGVRPCRLVSWYPDVIPSEKIRQFWSSIEYVAGRGIVSSETIPHRVSVEAVAVGQ